MAEKQQQAQGEEYLLSPQEYSCEICGASGLSDDIMREHTRTCHVEGNAQCPFCGLCGVGPAELLLHVNQAHLDYLTPENELMSFIDDQSPSIDGDSDSISECRGLSPSITEIPGINNDNNNGTNNNINVNNNINNNNNINCINNNNINNNQQYKLNVPPSISNINQLVNRNINKQQHSQNSINNLYQSENKNHQFTSTVIAATSAPSPSSSLSTTRTTNHFDVYSSNSSNNSSTKLLTNESKICDNNESNKEYQYNNGLDVVPNGSKGSPLRSQLGLKLKKNNVPATIITNTNITTTASSTNHIINKNNNNNNNSDTTTINTPSPLHCPLCPYTSHRANILEEHINRTHFDPLSPSVNNSSSSSSSSSTSTLTGNINNNTNSVYNTLNALACPLCIRTFESVSDLELHVNIEHKDILSPAKIDRNESVFDQINNQAVDACGGGSVAVDNNNKTKTITTTNEANYCPICNMLLDNMSTQELELHIEGHFNKSPTNLTKQNIKPDFEKEAQKLREQREFEMLRAQYGMDDQGNFREQSATAMQRAVYAGEMSVADYYERQVGLRAAESHGIDDGTSCTKSVAARVLSVSSASPAVIRTLVCSSVDHYASSYGDKGWGCGYRNLQMLLSSLLQNTTYNEALYSAWGKQGPSRTAMPSISRLQKMVEAAWAQGFDVQGSEQLGCKLYNTRKWIGATEVLTVLSWLRINCQLIDFHRPTSSDGRHPELFNWVLRYFDGSKIHTPPLYLQHQGHSRTIIGIEQRVSGLTLLILDPSHGPRQVAALGASQESLRLIRRGPTAMRAPQYQIVAVKGLIDTEEQYQASKILRSIRIPSDC